MSVHPRNPDSGTRLRVLILEDNPDDAELVLRELRRGGFEPSWERVETAEDFSAALTQEWDVILTDFSMPRFNAFGALEVLEGRRDAPPCIVVSGTIGEDTAVAAIKAGAADYLMKDRLARLAPTIRRELRDRAVRRLHEAEQRRAQEAIQKLFSAIEQTVDSIVMTDAEGRIQYVNPGFQRLYGYSKAEVLGKTPSVLKSGRHEEGFYRAFWNSLISGEGFRGEIVNKTKDGRFLTVELSAKAIIDETGKRTGFIAVHHDIDEKKRAEDELRASEAALRKSELRLRTVIETEPECVKAVDRNGNVVDMNAAGLAMLEAISLSEVQQRPLLDFILPEYRGPFVALHQRVMKGESGSLQFEIRGLRGSRRWLDTHAAPLRNASGDIDSLLGITRDITEQKRAEEALRESEARFRGAFETSPIGMALVAPDGRWLQINRRLCEIMGYSEQELLAGTFQDITHPDDLERDLSFVRQVLAGEIAYYQMEKRYIHKAGYAIWAHLTVSLVRDPQGAPLYFVSQVEDVTERKRAEDDLWRSQSQLRALTAHLQIVREDERTGIARELHDELGQAMTALKMDLASIRARVLSDDADSRKEAVRRIDAASEVADGMIDTIRRISSELRPGMLDDLGLLPAIEWLANDFSQRTGIACRLRAAVGALSPDRTRATAVFRILQETLTNVARHSKAAEVDVSLAATDGSLELEVRDDGKGFPPSVLRDASSLGLIGMRERAASVGGSIEFASKPGGGTTVRLRVPLPGPGHA